MEDEFLCRECGMFINKQHKGKAIDDEDKPIDVCVWCCAEEQKQQFYAEM